MFPGILRKYENCRVEDVIYIKVHIKHTDESPTQSFLDTFANKLGIDNMTELFTYPVRWRKMIIDTSDYSRSKYRITFGEMEFEAELYEISINRKLVHGTDIFEYTLEFMKPASGDLEDKVIVEAYLDYKEENEAGKKVYKPFEVKMELLEKTTEENTEEKEDCF